MDTISIRYGEDVTLPLDASDTSAVSADLYVGKPGEVYVLTKNITLTEGVGVFELDQTDTAIPLGTYNYQINVTDSDGYTRKYPSPSEPCGDCDTDFPKFIVYEALDVVEVS